jgi:hypothetical protein
LSPEANEAVISSFAALSVNLAMRSAELADGLVRNGQAVARREPPGYC